MILDPRTAHVATGIPVRTIQRWVIEGRLVDYGDGLTIRVDVDEVQELAALRDTRPGHRLPLRRTVTYGPCQSGCSVTRVSPPAHS